MYKIKTMALACAMMLCGLSAAAQFSTGSSSSSTTTEPADYNQVGVSFVNESFSFDYPKDYEMENVGLNGFGLKYIHGFSVSKSLPMFLETGLSFNFNFGSKDIAYEDYDGYYSLKEKYQHAALSVPVNFAYKFNINENFAVKPYLGLNFKFNILGRMKYEVGEDYDDDDYDYWRSAAGSRGYDDWDDWDDDEYGDKWTNLYDKKEMGDAPWNRFQMGWQIGADVQFKKFFLGLEYGTDFIKAQSKKVYGEKLNVNSGTFKVTLGFCF